MCRNVNTVGIENSLFLCRIKNITHTYVSSLTCYQINKFTTEFVSSFDDKFYWLLYTDSCLSRLFLDIRKNTHSDGVYSQVSEIPDQVITKSEGNDIFQQEDTRVGDTIFLVF